MNNGVGFTDTVTFWVLEQPFAVNVRVEAPGNTMLHVSSRLIFFARDYNSESDG